jgi:hypothetical protein
MEKSLNYRFLTHIKFWAVIKIKALSNFLFALPF